MNVLTKIRLTLAVFIIFLLLSGITAFPLRTELYFLMEHKTIFPDFMQLWITEIYRALSQTPDLVLYGTDWLAFAHIIIALFFIPVCIDPLKHKANVVVAMTACVLVFFIAFICGPIREIPFFHQLIDCSFGFIGFWPLLYVFKKIKQIETSQTRN